jgi:hypothetical protein
MAFNLGRFAAGLAQGGIQTYMSLSEIEQKQKELALREEAAAREKTEFERKLAVDKILAEASAPEATVGTGQSMSSVAGALPIAPKGGQYDNPEYRQAFTSALSKMTPEQQQSTLRQYGSVMPEGVGGAPAQQGGMAGVSTPARSAIDLGKATTYKGDDGQIYVTDKTRTRSQDEISERFMELAGKSGSSLAMEKAMDYEAKRTQALASKQALRVGEQSLEVGKQNLELGAKQLVLADMSIGAAKREQNYRENLDKFSERTLKTQEILETLPNVGLKEAPGLVNGALKDFGLTAKYIEPTGDAAKKQIIGGVQMGTVEVRDSKGKVVGSFNSVAEIQGALNGQMEQYHNTVAAQLVQMLPNPADRIKFMNDAKNFVLEKAKVDIMGRQAASAEKSAETSAAELKAKIDAGLFSAQADQAKGAAASSRAHANVYNNMAALAKTNAEAGKVMKPYIEEFAKLSPEDQAGAKGQSVLLEAATAAAKKTGDVTAIINALKKPDRSAVSAEERKEAYQDLREAGTNPEAVEAVKAKWANVFGEDPLVTAFKEAKGKDKSKDTGDKKTAIPITLPPAPPSAKQTEKALRDEWADLKARQKLVGASPEAKAKSALRIQEIEQTLNGVKPSNKLIKTD